jgi:hypothetical protein
MRAASERFGVFASLFYKITLIETDVLIMITQMDMANTYNNSKVTNKILE